MYIRLRPSRSDNAPEIVAQKISQRTISENSTKSRDMCMTWLLYAKMNAR